MSTASEYELDVGVLDDFAPLRDFGAQPAAEFVGRHRARVESLFLKLRLHVARFNSGSELRRERSFIERLIGTIRREYLDRVFFWNGVDLMRKLAAFQNYYNEYRVHRSLGGTTPAHRAGASSPAPAALDQYAWQQHCRGLFQTPIAA